MDFLLNQYYLQMTMFIIINAILGVSMYLTMSTGQLSLLGGSNRRSRRLSAGARYRHSNNSA